jgi:dTDP-glucose 4,6-dehydratase
VEDLIDGIILLLESDEHLPVNLGNPDEVSILELAELVNQLTNNQAGIVFVDDLRSDNDPQRRQPDISRAKKLLNWEPKVSLVDGLTKTIAYYIKGSKNS